MNIVDLEFVTPRKAKQFENKGITTVEELLKIVPKKYFAYTINNKQNILSWWNVLLGFI